MRGAATPGIIGSEMPGLHDERTKKAPWERGAEVTRCSAPITVAVCGDPIVGRALVLLLRGSRYEAWFLPASSLGEPGLLESVGLLLLTPTPGLSTKRREALLAAIRDAPGTAEIPILKLVTPCKGRDESGYVAFWPCSTEELERRIEAVLLANPKKDRAASYQGP